jgi:hypothetical protein
MVASVMWCAGCYIVIVVTAEQRQDSNCSTGVACRCILLLGLPANTLQVHIRLHPEACPGLHAMLACQPCVNHDADVYASC